MFIFQRTEVAAALDKKMHHSVDEEVEILPRMTEKTRFSKLEEAINQIQAANVQTDFSQI